MRKETILPNICLSTHILTPNFWADTIPEGSHNKSNFVYDCLVPTLDIEYLKNTLPPTVEDEFFDYLKNLTPNDITIYALKEGSIAFPRRG